MAKTNPTPTNSPTEPKSVVIGYEPVNENSPLGRSYEHIKVQPILDSIQVKPTVEKWEEELNKIPLIEIKMMNDVWNSLKLVPSPKLVSFIRTLIAQSVQEAKAEMADKISKLKPRGFGFDKASMEMGYGMCKEDIQSELNFPSDKETL